MTRPKLILVPETAVKDLKTIPVATCRTCLSFPLCDIARMMEWDKEFFCRDWEPKP